MIVYVVTDDAATRWVCDHENYYPAPLRIINGSQDSALLLIRYSLYAAADIKAELFA